MLERALAAVLDRIERRLRHLESVEPAPSTNLLTNPGFEVWQRGTGPFTASGVMTADRWQVDPGGGSSISISRDSANADAGSLYCAALTYTHANESGFPQFLETYIPLRGRTLTFSIRVKTSTPNAVRAALYDGGAAFAYSAYHSGSGAYETLTVTAQISPTASQVRPTLRMTASGTFYVDNATLVVGAQPMPYVPLHAGDDLARCQRYYEVVGGRPALAVYYSFWIGSTPTYYGLPIRWATEKAVTPTLTKTGTWAVNNCGQPEALAPAVDGFRLAAASTATGQGWFYDDTSDDQITAQANP